MFSWFKRKPPQSPLALVLGLEDSVFVQTVASTMISGPLASGAMCIVAYRNLTPMMSAAFEVGRQTGDGNLPSNLDGFIRFIIKMMDEKPGDVEVRRLMWLFQAALILRATRLAESNDQLVDNVAQTWLALARGGSVLRNALEHNVLWSDGEKECFTHINGEKSGMEYLDAGVPAEVHAPNRNGDVECLIRYLRPDQLVNLCESQAKWHAAFVRPPFETACGLS